MRGDPQQRMFQKAKELLWRQRQIHPFPCDKEDVALSLLPPEWQDQLLSDDDHGVVRWSNLTQCVSRSRSMIVELDGQAGHAFWMRFQRNVPTPNDQTAAFAMHSLNAHYDTVKEWWDKATEIHSELSSYERILWSFLERADHPDLVKSHWPELHVFVSFPMTPATEVSLTKRRLMPQPSVKERTKIIETLVGCSLLEERECNAWVDYEVEDDF